MRAAFYTRQGPARDVFQVGEQPTPQPAEGQVRVKLRTSGVNPSDWKVRSGSTRRKLTDPLIIPHSDGGGDIDAIGPGVPMDRLGERVWIWNGQWKRPQGTAAEYIVVPQDQAVRLPATVSYAEAACFGIPALTAIQAVRLSDLERGGIALITGGAGAVGHYAIQLAKLRGATVIATVSSDAKAQHAKDAGADHVVNYRTENVVERIRDITENRGVDAVIEVDIASNAKLYASILRAHATVVVYGTAGPEATVPSFAFLFNSVNLRFFLVYDLTASDRGAVVKELTSLLESNRLRHAVARRLPLDAIAEAHDMVERGDVIGNVVLDIA